MEIWRVLTTYEATVGEVRRQLPIGQPNHKLEWCREVQEPAITSVPESTRWDWGAEADMLQVIVSRDGTVAISHGPHPVGCSKS